MPIRTRRSVRAAVALAALVAALSLPGVAQQTPTPLAVTALVGPTAEALPFFWALQQGLFTKAGLSITVGPSASGSMTTTAVIADAAQLGGSNVLSEIQAHLKGLPVVLLAAGAKYDARLPNNEVFVSANSPIKTARDLEGKTVAVASLHDMLSLSLRSWIDKEGADISKIKFVEMPPSSQLVALQEGRVDAIHVYEPFRGQAERAGARAIVAPYGTIGNGFAFSVWFSNTNFVTQHRDAALRFAQVMHDAALYTNAHYDELIPLIASFSKMTPDDVRAIRRVYAATSLKAADIQPVIEAAYRYHEIDRVFPAQELILPGVP